jgi:hypothetical protein
MLTLKTDLIKLKFKETDISFKVSPTTRRIEYDCQQVDNGKAGVYLFLHEVKQEEAVVLYVGKAGHGIRKRIEQHKAGFKRNKNNGIYSKAIQTLFNYAQEQKDDELEVSVWFRESPISTVADVLGLEGEETSQFSKEISRRVKETRVSRFSNEEEALISLFYNTANPQLINRSIPTCYAGIENTKQKDVQASDLVSMIDTIADMCGEHEHRAQLKTELKEISDTWTENDGRGFVQALEIVIADLAERGLTPKIIQKYSNGPFRNQPLLVFGLLEKGRVNFKKHSNNLYFTLDGRHMVKEPWDADKIRIFNTADLLDH